MTEEQLEIFDRSENPEPPRNAYPAAFLTVPSPSLRLTGLRIAGLKAFDETEVELPRLAVLTGPNNSGKSTVLQAIALGFECLRRCVDSDKWRILDSGRSVTEFDFLPVNEARDLWYRRAWKPSRDKERYVEIALRFDGGLSLEFRIRFLFGVLNIRLSKVDGSLDEATLKALLASAPVLIPATPGPSAHEDYFTLAAVHRMLAVREPSRVMRNILKRVQDDSDRSSASFIDTVLQRYFGVTLETIKFDERRDLELRSPLRQGDYSLDIVSAGSGLAQILQLASVIAWRRPSIVLLDEPDAHLHSSVQSQLFGFLTELVGTYGLQIILSTHSRDLISQAPLESIIPVDATSRRLSPLQSIEHLLLEYQRFGSLSNVDLALLYQTKSCLFLEGVSDVRLLPRIASQCDSPLFSGPGQVVPFEFQGVDKLKFLPDLVRLFERLVGSRLSWGVIRDSDSNVAEVRAEYARIGSELGATYFHQWDRHSLENYLLEPGLLCAAIRTKRPDLQVTEDVVSALLADSIREVEDSVTGAFVTRAQTAYKDLGLSERPYDDGATAATRYLRELDSVEKKLRAYPGKRVFGAFVAGLQARYGVNLRIDEVVAEMNPRTVDGEVSRVLMELWRTMRPQRRDAGEGVHRGQVLRPDTGPQEE